MSGKVSEEEVFVASKIANSFSFAGGIPEDEAEGTLVKFRGGSPLDYIPEEGK